MPGLLRESRDSVTYGTTKVERTIAMASAPVFGGLGLFCAWVALDPVRFGATHRAPVGTAMLLFLFVAMSAIALYAASQSSVREIDIFPDRRTYRLTERKRLREGDYSDLIGLRFRVQHGKNSKSYCVDLMIANSKDMPIYMSTKEEVARQELERIAKRLSLPLIEA